MRTYFRSAVAFLTLIAIPPSILGRQASGPAPPSDTLLRVTTHMVLVDVVVVDKSGQPVLNLTQNDFTVLDDGKPQKIASFSVHNPATKKAEAPPVLPPHVATNRPEATMPTAEGTTAVILLDGLNTPPQKQIYLKQQMLKYLAEHFDPSVKLAVMTLTSNVNVLQDFTSNPLLLKAALDRYVAQLPALARAGGDRDLSASELTPPSINLPAQATGGPAGSSADPTVPGSAGGSNSSIAEDIGYLMRRFEKEAQNFSRDARVSATLAALQDISRYMAGQRGRKVLIWISAGFPISIVGIQPEDLETSREYSDQIRRTANLLNDAHVAIYAIDAKGLYLGSLSDPENSGRDASGRLTLTVEANRALSKEAFERMATENTLQEAALETGGKYFANRNDLDMAVSLSLKDSAAYYLLGYYPITKKWDGKFHQIKIKVSRANVEVRHRGGYFAFDPLDWRKGGHDKDMASAVNAETLPSTEVLFMARALPPAHGADVNVEFLVDPSTISFETQSGNEQYCNLNLEVQAFTPGGKLVKAEVQSAEAPLKAQTYERVRRQGLPMQVPIRLPAGTYVLHLGVRDNRTGMFGTARLPVEVGR